MTDYFVYNGEHVLPTYLPGVTSYGQRGSDGNIGNPGSSVHYTSFNLDDNNDLSRCYELLNSKKLLSNNFNESDAPNDYHENDLVIDSTGNFYKVVISGKVEETGDPIYVLEKYKTETNKENVKFNSFTANVCTSYLKNTSYGNKIDNPYYKEINLIAEDLEDINLIPTRKLYHSNIYRPTLKGNWIKFSIDCEEKQSYSYTFNLVLPNGEVLSIPSQKPTAVMFIDNKHLMSCAGVTSFKIPYNILEDFGEDLKNELKDKTVLDFSYSSLHEELLDKGISSNYVTMILSVYIEECCTAYAEVKNLETGKVYHLDTFDYKNAEEQHDFIVQHEPHIIFQKHENDDFLPSSKVTPTGEGQGEIYRAFGNYVVYSSIMITKSDGSSEVKSSDLDFGQGFYFIDKNGMELPEGVSIESTIYEDWKRNLTDPTNKAANTLYVKFKGLSKFTIEINFKKFINKDGKSVFPKSVVYIGFPNINLYQEGEDGKVYLMNSYHYKQRQQEGPEYEECDGAPGIYYLYKFIPFGYSLNESNDKSTIADAGAAAVNIDIDKFGLNPNIYNFIEIGVIPFGDISNDEHRAAIIVPDDGELDDYRFAEAHDFKHYLFDGPYTTEDNNFSLDTDTGDGVYVSGPGKQDVGINVSSAVEYIEKELEDAASEEDNSVLVQDTTINYVKLGLLYDTETYIPETEE